jgi:O-antigen ligase
MLAIPDRPPSNSRSDIIPLILCVFLCALPVIAAQLPRFLTLAPGLAGIALFVAQRFVYGTWPKLSCNAFAWMLAMAALMAVSALWAINPDAALERAAKTAVLLFSGALLFSVSPTMSADSFRRFFPCAMVVTAALLFIDLYFDLPIFRIFHPNEHSLHSVGNYSGLNRSVVFFTLCLFPALACLRGRMKTPIGIAFAVLTALVLFKTDSQSAQVAAAGGLFLYGLFQKKIKAAWICLFAGLAAAMLAMPWIVQWGFQNFAAYSAQHAEEGTVLYRTYAAVRLEIWDFVARKALQNPLIGFGADATEFLKFDTARLYFEGDHVLHTHNFVLQLWLEFGVIGVLMTLAFFAMTMKKIYAMDLQAHGPLLATMFATIAAAATSYGLWQGWWLGTFCLLFTFGILSVRKPQ